MKAMVLNNPGLPLLLSDMPIPEPAVNEVLLRVVACAICRTDLHIIDGELTKPKLPLIPGHQIVGIVEKLGSGVSQIKIGDRVGVPWLGQTCGKCKYCIKGNENLCENAVFTGYTRDGGFAQYTVAHQAYCFPIPDNYSDIQAAPLLCAGLIGYRAYRFTEKAETIAFYGFGAAAHILCQAASFQGKSIYAFTRPGDNKTQEFALRLGATWAGGTDQILPILMDAAILFAPAGELVPLALKHTAPGGKVVCAGIHMSDIPSFPYKLLWEERSIQSVANLTRADGLAFLKLASQKTLTIEVTTYPLSNANDALDDLRNGKYNGAGVILPWK